MNNGGNGPSRMSATVLMINGWSSEATTMIINVCESSMPTSHMGLIFDKYLRTFLY